METLIYILGATLLISSGALVGIVTLAMQEERLEKILLLLVSLSAGALMGGAFLHLLPEAVEELGGGVFEMVLVAFVGFFVLEKVLHWRHCHKGRCGVHSFGYLNLFGDAIHNFIDGLVLAGAFVVDIRLGMVTTLAVALHEIPQEVGDFGVLLYAGFEKKKALLANFGVALMVVVGGVLGYWMAHRIEGFVPYLLPLAAGGFIYIAASDLLPEIRKEKDAKKSVASFGMFMLGIVIMLLVRLISRE